MLWQLFSFAFLFACSRSVSLVDFDEATQFVCGRTKASISNRRSKCEVYIVQSVIDLTPGVFHIHQVLAPEAAPNQKEKVRPMFNSKIRQCSIRRFEVGWIGFLFYRRLIAFPMLFPCGISSHRRHDRDHVTKSPCWTGTRPDTSYRLLYSHCVTYTIVGACIYKYSRHT